MGWTDERVELLKKLWAEGLSARQIADQLGGGVTRNAVIGKVHRLGLSGRATTSSTQPRAKAARKPAKKRAIEQNRPASTGGAGSDASQRPAQRTSRPNEAVARRRIEAEPVDSRVLNLADELDIPLDERVDIEGLKEGQCKWPIGDPTHEDFHFCGRKQHGEGVYCEFHAAKAYQPARRTQRKKEQRQLLSYR